MTDALGPAQLALSKSPRLTRSNVISWSPSGWSQVAVAPMGTGILTAGCSGSFRAVRVGIQNAGVLPFTIAKIIAGASESWNDYVSPSGGSGWRRLTFANGGALSDQVVDDPTAPSEITAWPSAALALPGCGVAPRWTWTDWAPVQSVGADPTTGMYVLMLRWLNALPDQQFTYANGKLGHRWTGAPETNHGFDCAIGGYNNGADHVTNAAYGDMDWDLCQVNSPLNGTPLAVVQFWTDQPGIVGIVAGDSHQSGAGTISNFNGFLAQSITTLGQKHIGTIPFGFVNCAVGGIASEEIFARLGALLPAVRPSFAVLPGWTYNDVADGAHLAAKRSEEFYSRLLKSAQTCRQHDVEPIFLTPFPRDEAAMTPEVLHSWRALRAEILRLQSEGALIVDGGAKLGVKSGGQFSGTYQLDLSTDRVHPNDLGHSRVAEDLSRIVEIMAELPQRERLTERSHSFNDVETTERGEMKGLPTRKTLLFCTSYAESLPVWNERWGRWLGAVTHSGIIFDKLLIVDDGSPVLPEWPGVEIVPAGDPRDAHGRICIHHFADRRGRQVNGEPFPGWYRSFSHAVLYAMEQGYDRIIHIESDAFLITDRAIDFFNSCDSGWVSLWCIRHRWPESTLQIINKDQFVSCGAFFSKPYSAHLNASREPVEVLLPLTSVNKSLIGDRYGEEGDSIPFTADYVSQVRWNMGPDYYWWLSESGARKAPGEGWLEAMRSRGDAVARKRPRIVALSMVKNEQDIIEPFVRHTSDFVDYHVLLDNGSVDETRRILVDLMREIDGVAVTTISEFGYKQSERMTKLLRACQTAFFADYVIFLDADEFISSENRSEFEAAIKAIPVGCYGRIPWRTFVRAPFETDRDAHDPPRSMPWRKATEHDRTNVILRLDGQYLHDLEIEQGNHSITSIAGRRIDSVRLEGVFLDHFPLRSVAQFRAKSIVGWMAYLAKDPNAANKGQGYHWRDNFNIAISSPPISYEMLCDASLRYDQPSGACDWSTDVVRGVPPDKYERRYSSGRYADPLWLVARSWQATLEVVDPPISFSQGNPPVGLDELSKGDTAFDSRWHWENPFADVPPFRYVAEKYRPTSVLDVGCGIGAYLSLFKKFGATEVFGVDGIPSSATMLGDGEYKEMDLSKPVSLERKFDLVICLEVIEHLPPEAAETFMKSLSLHAQGLIVFSGAEPGQPGHGHINCLPIDELLVRWGMLGWFPAMHETLVLRALSTLPWFKRNLIVLKRGGDEQSGEAIIELSRIGCRQYKWGHCNPGVRAEMLIDDMPVPPYGYSSDPWNEGAKVEAE